MKADSNKSTILTRAWTKLTEADNADGHLPDDRGPFVYGVRLLLLQWRLPLFGAMAGLSLAVLYLSTATPLYTARMIVGPAQTSDSVGSQASGLRQQLNSLIGETGGTAVDPFTLYKQLITSSYTAQRLQQHDHALQLLYSSQWDAQHKEWKQPTGLSAIIKGLVRQAFGKPAWMPPDISNLQTILKDGIDTHSNNGSLYFYVYEFKNPDPKVAARFLDLLYKATDAEARTITLARADALSDYIQKKLSIISEAGYRAALYQALAQQDMLRVMGRSNAPFAAQVVDPPRASSSPTDPSIFRTVIYGMVLGMALGGMLSFAMAWLKKKTDSKADHAPNAG